MQIYDKDRLVGVILAGGLSRRMGGGDKGLAALGATTMIGEVVRRTAPQVGRLVLNANGDAARFSSLGVPVVADTVEGFVGPLAGVLAALDWTRRHVPAATHVLSVSSDAPFLPRDLALRLSGGLDAAGAGIALARSDGEVHPVIGLWPVALADDLDAALRAGVRKVLAWTDRHGTVPVDFALIDTPMGPVDPFFNANTPAELDEARRLLPHMPA